MNFKYWLTDFIKKHRDFYVDYEILYCKNLECTNDISFLIENDEEMSKSEFINELYKEIVDTFAKELEWKLLENGNNILTVESYVHNIFEVLKTVKSY